MEMKNTLQAGLPSLGLDLPDATCDTLCAFGHAVIEQNKVMNLTAITEPTQVAKLHLLDSLSVLSVMPLAGKTGHPPGGGADPGSVCQGCSSVFLHDEHSAFLPAQSMSVPAEG